MGFMASLLAASCWTSQTDVCPALKELELGAQNSRGIDYLFNERLLGINPTDVPAQMGNDTCAKLFSTSEIDKLHHRE